MAKKDKSREALFIKTHPHTLVDVFRYKGDEVKKETMTFEQFLDMEKLSGYVYRCYQVGFCTTKENIKL